MQSFKSKQRQASQQTRQSSRIASFDSHRNFAVSSLYKICIHLLTDNMYKYVLLASLAISQNKIVTGPVEQIAPNYYTIVLCVRYICDLKSKILPYGAGNF